jgi:probable phosphoglycerate mutase
VSPCRILLIRHAIPDADGTKDPALGELGRAQARDLAESLMGEPIEAIYSSHLRRAAQTAAEIAAARSLGVELDEGLREWQSNSSEYVRVENLDDPLRAAAWNEGRFEDFLPVHNSDELRATMRATMARLGRAHQGSQIVAVSHGGAMNTFLASVVESPRRFFFNPGYTSLSRVDVYPDSRFVLVSINERHHVRD